MINSYKELVLKSFFVQKLKVVFINSFHVLTNPIAKSQQICSVSFNLGTIGIKSLFIAAIFLVCFSQGVQADITKSASFSNGGDNTLWPDHDALATATIGGTTNTRKEVDEPISALSPIKIPGLTNGASYTPAFRAVNAVGVSVTSAAITASPVSDGPACDTYTNKTTANGLGNNRVDGVYAIGTTVYAATFGGLSISTDGGASFTNKTTANGLGNNRVNGVYAIGTTVYAATTGGLSISIDGGASFTNKTTVNGLGSNIVNGVYAIGTTVYAAASSRLAISIDGGANFTNKTTANGLGSNVVNGVYAIGSTVYAATLVGLSISTNSGTSFSNKTTANGLGSNVVNGVYAIGSTVYAATRSGLSISTDGGANFTNKTTANGLGNNEVYGVYAIGTTVYAATLGGLSISTDGGANFTNKTTTNGLGYHVVFSVYAIGTTVYAATFSGLSFCATVPSAPTSLSAVAGNGQLQISFTAGNNGGSTITNYEYTLDGGTTWTPLNPVDGTSPVTISGLTNGTSYTLALRAVNAVGLSVASASVTATPATVPSAPTSLSAVAGNGQVQISFTAGADGGSAITNYEYSLDNGTTWTALNPVDISSPVTITGLTNGTTYLVKIRGVNTAGQGAASSAISVITGISLSNQSITVDPIANQTYTGSALTPAMVVKDGTTKLTLSTDYTVAYTANINVGTATATITGAGNYTGTKTQTFVIVARPIVPSGLSYSPATQTVRQGAAISPLIPTISGDTPGYTISPALAAGLSINATSGIISGTLTAAQTGTVRYTVTASNSEGSTTSTVTLVFNTAPTGISLSPSAVAENASSGTTVGTLSATDQDAGDTFTYELVSGTGGTDNALFTIDGANLKATTAFDFEAKSSYTVRVRTTDAGGLSFEQAIAITVINVNDTPTDLTLSTTTINENNAASAIIGNLSSTDQDAGDTHTYALVSGTGGTDNALFTIDGANLKATTAFDFETKSSYTVRVRTSDAGGLSFEQAIAVTVINVNDTPTDLALSAVSIYENNAIGATIGEFSSKDQDAVDKHTYTLVSGDVAAFNVSGNQLLANAVYVHGTKNSYEIVVKSTDAGGLSVNKSIRITILESPEVIGRANLAQSKQSSVVGQNITISKGYSANLVLIASNIVKYAWSPATGLSSTNISNPIANPTQTTTYTVRVTNAQGISTDVFVTVTVLEDYNITPNNVLSPDGDGVNDFWTIENLSAYPTNEVKIFDKAGRIIFNSKNYQNTWNGQLNGETLHEGTYYYVINLGPGTRPKTGYITLFSNK